MKRATAGTPNMPVVAELAFDLIYEGPALANNEMDARDFARSVLSAAELFRDLNREAFPNAPDVNVNVRAIQPGSFEVMLKLVNDAEGMLASTPVSALLNLQGLVNLFSGIVRVIRHRSRSEIAQVEPLPADPGQVSVVYQDGTRIEVPRDAVRASEQLSIRRELADMTAPVTGEGIDDIALRVDTVVIERIDKADARAIEMPIGLEGVPQLLTSERDAWLQIVSVHFTSNNKWQFSDGGAVFWARVADAGFQQRIEDGEGFRKGDRIRATLRESQWTDIGGRLRTDREIVRVLDHTTAGQQEHLDLMSTRAVRESRRPQLGSGES